MTQNLQKEYEFQAEIKKLLNILSKSLYTHKEIFLRELISNSVDALKKIKFILLTNRDVVDPDAELKIEIVFNPEEKTLTIQDTGIGMVKKELINDLGTIAGSGTEKFVEQVQKMKEEGKSEVDLDIVGQFGIGFYSLFMVADKVKVITKSYQLEEPAYSWESDGTGKFTIEEIERKSRGTDVILYLKDDAEEYLNQYRLETIIKKYSNFVSFPIFVTEIKKEELSTDKKEKTDSEDHQEAELEQKKEPVNQIEPLWKKMEKDISEEDYKNFYHYISNRYDDYLHVINYNVEGQVRFHSLIFIPENSARLMFLPESDYGLSLYSRKILIMEKCEDLIPKWMRFVTGVVESDDIPLNISRETIQTNRTILKMRDILTKKFLRELIAISENNADKYKKFWGEFGELIKEGIISDPVRQDRLKKLLRFKTTKTSDGEVIGLKDYIDRIKEGQEEIFYLVGENLETLKISPHLGYYEKNDLEVILFDEPIDNFLMMNLHDYSVTEGEGDDAKTNYFKFTPIDVAEKEEKETEDEEKKEAEKKEKAVPKEQQKFLEKVKELLGEKIIDATMSDKLYGNPCRLANPADGPSSSQQRAMRYWTEGSLPKKFQIPKKVIEFNPDHPIVKGLIQINKVDSKNALLEPMINQLFENSLLIEGDLPDPASMVPRIIELMEELVKRYQNS